jgi:hypothetical protein
MCDNKEKKKSCVAWICDPGFNVICFCAGKTTLTILYEIFLFQKKGTSTIGSGKHGVDLIVN